MVYLFLLALALLGSYNFKEGQFRRHAGYFTIILCITVLVFGLRYRVGIDTIRYETIFNDIPTLSKLNASVFSETAYAPLFVILVSLCKSVINDYVFFQFTHALIINLCLFRFFKERSVNPFASVFIYFIISCVYFNTEILRESLAISIFALNYKNLEKKRWLKYYLLAIVSLGFHYSAIIIFFVPLLYRIKLKKKLFLYLIIYLVVVRMLTGLIEAYIPVVQLAARYSGYIDIKEVLDISVMYYVAIIVRALLIPALLLFYNKRFPIEQNTANQSMLIVYCLVSLTGIVYPLLFDRLANYFVIFYIIYIANTIYALRINHSIKYVVLVGVVMSFFFYLDLKDSMLYRYYPYHSIFDKHNEPKREMIYNDEVYLNNGI